MNINDIFPYNIDPNTISVYVGRVIKLDENFEDNGILFVDLCDPNGTDLDKGAETANIATASFAVRNTHKCWQSPPEILSKTNFKGAMTATMSGDFHLQNYCFDMQSITWFATVSAALNALGIVNIPPVMMSMDQTPFPGKAVSINLASALEEFINELLDAFLREIESEEALENIFNTKSLEDVISDVGRKINGESVTLDPMESVIYSVVNPVHSLADTILQPYITFLRCISYTLQLVQRRVSNIMDWTFPITNFADSDISQDTLSVRTAISKRIDEIGNQITDIAWPPEIAEIFNHTMNYIVESTYNPLAYLFTTLNNTIKDIIVPLKKKLVEVINSAIRKPLLQIANTIAMSIQPMVSSLPTIVQLVVKYAIKALIRTLLGVPINSIMSGLAEPIKSILEESIKAIKNQVSSFITSFAGSLINPIIKKIQDTLYSLIPCFTVNDLNTLCAKLKEWKNQPLDTPIPLDIYVDGTVDSKKSFEELDWSNPKDVAAFIIALVSLIKNTIHDPSSLELTEEVREIYQSSNGIPFGSNLTNTSEDSLVVDVYNEADDDYDQKTILPKQPLVEGNISYSTPSSGMQQALFFYNEYNSKEEFLPIFELLHTPVNREALLSDSDMSSAEVKEWITNKALYIETQIDGETVRYIVNNTSSDIYIHVTKDNTVKVESDKIYLSQEIPHVSMNEDDPVVGTDLVPQYDSDYNPIPLTIGSITDDGQPLYKVGFNDPSKELSAEDEKTFAEISDIYYMSKTPSATEEKLLIDDLVNKLNEDSSPESAIRSSLFYESFSLGMSKRKVNEDSFCQIIPNPDTKLAYTVSSTQIEITLSTIISPNKDTDFKIIITILLQDGDYISTGYTCRYFIPVQNVITHLYTYEERLEVEITWTSLVSIEGRYCAWLVSYLGSKPVVIKPDENFDRMVNLFTDMFQHTLSALSQENFDLSFLLKAIVSKITSCFDKIAGVVEEIMDRVNSMLSTIDSLKNLTTIMDKIQSVSSVIEGVANTIEPALKATAQAASAVAIQSCSMTQSATGKDFTFNSGDNYDLSTTTTAKAQLPYCKELGREQFLEPNCKALVLAIGAGKQNLFVVDVLS